ncbi:nitroreductase family deazaflavin-dependent oxidoreductase [Nocardia tengchongensis]|uniref:nitroreductase family deazaflavin-dependent oxidoreductase n=1 Tax=Nocardia tengchongensis TaxID=2055889 RepID=UPI003697CFD6
MTGTALSLVLILASVGMLTSMRSALDIQFGHVDREDATVITAEASNELADQLRSIPAITAVEPTTLTPVTLSAHTKSYSTTLTGLTPDTTMHGFRTPGGNTSRLPATGILLGAAAAEQLGVGVGDTVTVTPALGTARPERLEGLLDEPLGTYAYATETTAADIGGTGLHGYLLRFSGNADRDTLRAKVSALPGILADSDSHAVRDQLNQFLGLFWVFIATLLIFGTLLAFTVIYVTMTVNLAERTTELATLRAAGVPVRRLTASLAAENLTATLLAVPLGLAAGYLAAWALLRSFTSDMFTFGLTLGIAAPALAAAAVLSAAALSQLPAARLVGRIDIAHVVRERAPNEYPNGDEGEPPMATPGPATKLSVRALRTRWVVRAPITVYRIGLGFVFGTRLLMLEHIGRRSGRPRYVVLEVVDHPRSDQYIVVSGFGTRAQWYRNIIANPTVRISIGIRRSTPATATAMTRAESALALDRYIERHPKAWIKLRGTIKAATRAPLDTLPMVRLTTAGPRPQS